MSSIMDEPQEIPLRRFNPKVMLDNIDYVRDMMQRIRQKEGGIGSVEDELSLHRVIQDLDLLVDITDGLKVTYEKMVQERNDRIKELETELGIRPVCKLIPDQPSDIRQKTGPDG